MSNDEKRSYEVHELLNDMQGPVVVLVTKAVTAMFLGFDCGHLFS